MLSRTATSSSSSSTCSRLPHSGRPLRGGTIGLALFFGAVAALHSQVPITNPSIPAQERIVYEEAVGDGRGTVSVDVRLVADTTRSYYEVRQESEKVSALFRIDSETLFPFYTEETTRGARAVVRRSVEVLQSQPAAGPDELAISDPSALVFVLRGFPWGSRDSARLVFLGGNGGGDAGQGFAFGLSVQGKETLKLNGASYECWRVQLGLEGAFGGLMPKTRLWFLVAAPHYLVKYEGPSGPPGSPKRVLTLREYGAVESP